MTPVGARWVAAAALAAAALALVAAGCGGGDDETAATTTAIDTALRGDILVDGSSTVGPLTMAAAKEFDARHRLVSTQIRVSGTGGGFEVFCQGKTDLSDASRRINASEVEACRRNGVEYEELRVASDGITVVTSRTAKVGTQCLTVDQLRDVWRRGSTVDNWRQIDPRFANAPLALAGPGKESGTYDFFNERILGTNAEGDPLPPRPDYTASEDDNVIVQAVEAKPSAMGYFGYSYYAENRDRLQALQLDADEIEGCVPPSSATIASGDYPLARPLYVYASKRSLDRPAVREFMRYYLTNATRLAESVDIVPAPVPKLNASLRRVDRES